MHRPIEFVSFHSPLEYVILIKHSRHLTLLFEATYSDNV